MMNKISAFIITKNEEHRIANAIYGVRNVADEVIVIDSGSSDKTVEIAKSLGAIVTHNAWEGYVKQKIFGESMCKHQWILNVDADEVLSEELQAEINYIFRSNIQERYDAYRINCVIMHRLDTKPRKYAPNNYCVRLYNKLHCGFGSISNSTTHDSVLAHDLPKDRIYTFNNPAYHYSGISIEQLVTKANFYSSEQAHDMNKIKRKISHFRLATEFITCFIKAFFIRRYFVFGFDGFVDSMIFAFARFLRLAKARELRIQKHKPIIFHNK